MPRSNRIVPVAVAAAGPQLGSVETQRGRGLVDPGPSDGFGSDLGGGALVVQHDEGLIRGAATGERDVDAAGAGGAVEEQEAAIDGAALGGVAGLGIGQLDVVGDIVSG